MLSPKAAPERIAPPRSAGSAPTAIPAGKSVRLIALMVPKPEPVEIANRPENRNEGTPGGTGIMVGLVMGIHATIYLIITKVNIQFFDIIKYLPVSLCYILSMIIGYI